MKTEKDSRKITIQWSSVIPVIIGLLAGFAVGLNVGNQIDELPASVSMGLMVTIVMLGCAVLPAVRKREK